MNTFLVLACAFLFSFCSMGYELLLAKTVSHFTSDLITSQSITLGVYLLFQGIGTWVASSPKTEFRKLYFLELLLTSLGVLSVALAYCSIATIKVLWLNMTFAVDQLIPEKFLLISLLQILTAIIGFLTGFEIPLLMKKYHKKGVVLGISYFGSLVAAVALPVFLYPEIDLIWISLIIGFFNLVGIVFLLLISQSKLLYWCSPLILIPLFLIFSITVNQNLIQQFYLKSIYDGLYIEKLTWRKVVEAYKYITISEEIIRYHTPYQTIDIVTEGREGLSRSEDHGKKKNFTLYLDRQTQFSSNNYLTYHQSFVHGPLNLIGRYPKKVLVLGAGDGLLAAQLLKIKEIEHITQIELDAKMLNVSTIWPPLKKLNKASLFDPRVELIIQDAVSYLLYTKEKFEAIYVDFPYPFSYDLSKLYSVEFYELIRSRLTETGFAVFDVPLYKVLYEKRGDSIDNRDIVMSTLKAAKFSRITPFGPIDPFIVASMEHRDLEFNYNTIPKWLSNAAKMNMTTIEHTLDDVVTNESFVNSIFSPKRFDDGFL